jgi:ABC-type spermidine/putrescine transport system permease subunit II
VRAQRLYARAVPDPDVPDHPGADPAVHPVPYARAGQHLLLGDHSLHCGTAAVRDLNVPGLLRRHPRDLEEAAAIDGASRLQAFGLVVLPLAGPAIAAVAIFAFLFSYNEYLVAAIFLRREDLFTIPLGIQQFTQQYGTDWGSLMASATMAMLPTFVLFLFIQKYMMYGAIGSGVKG